MPCSSSCASADRTRGTATRPGRTRCDCIGQETTGPGGFAKALRTVPVVLRIADAVRAHAKPGRLDRRLHQPGRHRHPGAAGGRVIAPSGCATWRSASSAASPRCSASQPDEVALGHVGLNHLTWERAVTVAGRDILPELFATGSASSPTRCELPPALLAQLGVVPSYYLRYYYAHDEVLRGAAAPSRRAPRRCGRSSASCSRMYADPTRRQEARGARAPRRRVLLRGRRSSCSRRCAGHRRDRAVVNLRNDGVLPFLPDDHVIEVPARVCAAGVRGAAGRAAGRRHPGPDLGGRRIRAARARRRGPRRARTRAAGDAGAPAGAAARSRRASSPTSCCTRIAAFLEWAR